MRKKKMKIKMKGIRYNLIKKIDLPSPKITMIRSIPIDMHCDLLMKYVSIKEINHFEIIVFPF